MNLLRYPPLRYIMTVVTLGLVVDWLQLPALLSELQAETATYTASYSTRKGGRIMLQGADGKSVAISCRKAPALCDYARQLLPQQVTVDMVQPSLWQGRWVRQASAAGGPVEAEAGQQQRFAASADVQTALTAFFVAFSALLWGMAWRAKRPRR